MSGNMFFDKGGMEHQITLQPKTRGEIFYEGLEYRFRELPAGRVEVYEYPEKFEQYIVATDASEAVGLDEAAALVLNKRLNTTAAVVYGNFSPEELAELGISLGNWYNQAMIAPENKNYGYMVCQLINQKYGNIYKRILTRKGDKEKTEELGFNTNTVTRPQMLAAMNEEIKNKSTTLNAKALIDECRTFIIKRDDKGKVTKVEAQTGFQDGLVICRAIAGMVREQYPYIKNKKEYAIQSPGRLY
jgi:phage terminase large subunit